MWMTLAGLVLFALLALPVLPVARIRCIALGLLHRLSQVLALAAIGACAMFFMSPGSTPTCLVTVLEPMRNRLDSIVPVDGPNWIWLLIAVVIAAVSVPLLSLMDFARRLTSLTVLVRRLLGDIRDTAREMAASIANGEAGHKPPIGGHASDLKAAVECMEVLTKEESHSRPQRRRLIDLVSQ